MSATVTQIQESIHQLRNAREWVLENRTTEMILSALAETAQGWLRPTSKWRLAAIQQAPVATGFSEQMIREAINVCMGAITCDAMGELLDNELGDRKVLDQFCVRGQLQTRAISPQLITHFLAGNVPAPGIVSICSGLLLKAGNLVKASRHDPIFPVLFAESLREVDARLADCIAVLHWPRDDLVLTQAALREANAVIAYGDDDTISSIQRLAPSNLIFVGYGHKLSFAVIAREALNPKNLVELSDAAAFDVSIYDQQGCLSPHGIYVEQGGEVSALKFAAALEEAMARFQERVPRGALTLDEAAAIAKLRSDYEFRAAADDRVSVWSSPGSNDWTVIYDEDCSFVASCLNRVVFVKPIDELGRVLDVAKVFSGKISTVGAAPMNERVQRFAADLARLGVHRVCPLGQMQRPPLLWHHDGRPNVADLVRWIDVG